MRMVSELIFSELADHLFSITYRFSDPYDDASSVFCRLKSGNALLLFIAISDAVKRFNLVERFIDRFEFFADAFDV